MFTTAASLLTTAILAGQFSLTASPASYDTAAAHHSYTLRIADTGRDPEVVYSQFGRGVEKDGHCAVDFSHPDQFPWAHLNGAPVFRLRPGQMRTLHVTIAQPPPGKFELVATWLTRTGGSAQVHTAAGVGTALHFSEPGKTRVQPCPLAAPPHSTTPIGLLAGIGGALLAGVATCLLVVRLLRRRGTRGAV